MGTYDRFSRLCTVDQLRPELAHALRERAQKLNMGELDADVVSCCETRSERKKTGWLPSLLEDDRDPVHYTAVALTSQRLLWARSGEKLGTVVTTAQLKDLRVLVREAPKSREMLLDLTGYFDKSRQRFTGTLAVDAGPDGRKFADDVRKAVELANPQPKKKTIRIFGITIGE